MRHFCFRFAHFVANSLRRGRRRDSSRFRHSDHASGAKSGFVKKLRHLRRFSGAGFAAKNDEIILRNCFENCSFVAQNRQFLARFLNFGRTIYQNEIEFWIWKLFWSSFVFGFVFFDDFWNWFGNRNFFCFCFVRLWKGRLNSGGKFGDKTDWRASKNPAANRKNRPKTKKRAECRKNRPKTDISDRKIKKLAENR